MKLKTFERFLHRLQVEGHSMYEKRMRHELEQDISKKMPSYNEWERKMIIDAVKDIEF